MPAKNTGKRSTRNASKRERYKREGRRTTNKLRKIVREIKRLLHIKKRNPDSKVDRNIKDLKEVEKSWQTETKTRRKK